MSDFLINPKGLKTLDGSFDGTELKIREIQSEIRHVRNNLSFDSIGAIAIKAYLHFQIMNLGLLNNDFSNYHESLKQISALYALTEKSILNFISGTDMTDCVRLPDGRSRLEIGDNEKENIINAYEQIHPEEAKKLNGFLKSGNNNKLTDEDIRNIKFLIYTAKEPYRSLYLNNLDKIKFGNGDLGGGAYYSVNDKTINLTYPDSFKKDPRGAYTTWFHEYGHGIDDQADIASIYGSDTEKYKIYSSEMNEMVTLHDAINYDVFYNKQNPHSISSIADQIRKTGKNGGKGNLENVITAFQNGSSKNLNKDDRALYNAIKNQFARTTGKNASHNPDYEAVTDIYGGMSGNVLRNNGFGHDTSYWNDTNMPARELWAEYFSYNMAGDKVNLDHVREYFPEAVKVMDRYAMDLGARIEYDQK